MTINKNLFILILSIAIVGSVVTGLLIHVNSNLTVETEAKLKEIGDLQTEKAAVLTSKKLLEIEVKKLSSYKGLTESMIYRDACRAELKYSVGDFVILKRDSTTVLVKDIIIGGNKFEHYIRYEVVLKDNSREYVSQELLY